MARLDSNIPGQVERLEKPATLQAGKEFFFSPYAFNQYLLTCFLKRNFDDGKSVANYVSDQTWIKGEQFFKVIKTLEKEGFKFLPTGDNMVFERDDVFIVFDLLQTHEIGTTNIYATSKSVAEHLAKKIKKHCSTERNLSFCWIVNAQGDSVNVVEEWDEQVTADLYPFIPEFESYAQRFWDSRSNILILIGPPGTGKTTFIKHLLSYTQKMSYLTYDEKVLSNDQSFGSFIADSSAGAFIIEDADLFLKSRDEGNAMISRFLNIGDGLIKLKNKKLIFSTNLPSTKDIDQALVRPGRCFDIIDFRSLTRNEAEIVAENRNLQLVDGKHNYTLAEIFNSSMTKTVSRKVGFY